MPLVPKRVKHRREFCDKIRGATGGGKTIAFDEYGLMTLESHWITNRQIEAAHIAVTRYMKHGSKVWIRIFSRKPYTTRGVGVRIGSGKGAPMGWVAIVGREKIMFGIGGVSEGVAREALRFAPTKLLIRCKFIAKNTEVGGESNEG